VIRAVFFDWFGTLARYDPPREVAESLALAGLGFSVPPEKIGPALAIADRQYFEENTRLSMRKRSREEQARLYIRIQQTLLENVGIDPTCHPDLPGKLLALMLEYTRSARFALYDDVLPTMRELKKRKLVLGLLTNMDQDMAPLSRSLGIEGYIDFVVTSGEAGEDKPAPGIFLAALKKAPVAPAEAVHVGDQYGVDVVGARGVGIKALLVDRDDVSPGVTDCPRLRRLSEVTDHLG
jgi:putative hydrolase of the HAD superfamily